MPAQKKSKKGYSSSNNVILEQGILSDQLPLAKACA